MPSQESAEKEPLGSNTTLFSGNPGFPTSYPLCQGQTVAGLENRESDILSAGRNPKPPPQGALSSLGGLQLPSEVIQEGISDRVARWQPL